MVHRSLLKSFLASKQRQKRQPGFRPALESLEDRLTPAGSISGHVLQDVTGNGLSSTDSPLAHVTVMLYRDSNGNGVMDSHDTQAATRVSATDGSYCFNNLAAGTYFVSETVPANNVVTAPTTAVTNYVVRLAANQIVTGKDFDNFHLLNANPLSNISFTITSLDGTTHTVTDLRGHTHEHDTVTAHFTVAANAGPTTVSLVAYNAPSAGFDASAANLQTIVDDASTTFSPGVHSLSVTLPGNYYQVDFVIGSPIDTFGPSGSHVFYNAEQRLMTADNGGTHPLVQTPHGTGTAPGAITTTGSATVAPITLRNGTPTGTTTNESSTIAPIGSTGGTPVGTTNGGTTSPVTSTNGTPTGTTNGGVPAPVTNGGTTGNGTPAPVTTGGTSTGTTSNSGTSSPVTTTGGTPTGITTVGISTGTTTGASVNSGMFDLNAFDRGDPLMPFAVSQAAPKAVFTKLIGMK